MSAKIHFLILDRDDARSSDIIAAIQNVVEGVCIAFSHNAGDVGWFPDVPHELNPDFALFHWSDNDKLAEQTVQLPFNRSTIRIAYSGGGMAPVSKIPEGWLSIPRPLLSADRLSHAEWRNLCQWILDPNRSVSILPTALQETRSSTQSALCILCEAWLMNRDGQDASKDIDGSLNHQGIIVNAPVSPDQWFGPFVNEWERVPVRKRREAGDIAAVEIGAQVEDGKTDVERFLKRVAGLYAHNGIVGRAAFEEEIVSLLAKLKPAKS